MKKAIEDGMAGAFTKMLLQQEVFNNALKDVALALVNLETRLDYLGEMHLWICESCGEPHQVPSLVWAYIKYDMMCPSCHMMANYPGWIKPNFDEAT